ncbi:hypothetical protein MLD38_036498 [Melastoma candidum]|uniref:Uncharacterized protein n=1 Tax=Melastoma candidum TaxID=119954 RepID=A0ACB9LK32_9MYRT|nr:hypothetical protein MLD38_036498 [Melastoma candidum]
MPDLPVDLRQLVAPPAGRIHGTVPNAKESPPRIREFNSPSASYNAWRRSSRSGGTELVEGTADLTYCFPPVANLQIKSINQDYVLHAERLAVGVTHLAPIFQTKKSKEKRIEGDMDRGRLPVAKRTRSQTERFYRQISGGAMSRNKKSNVAVEREGGDEEVVFLGFLGKDGGYRSKPLVNEGEVRTPEGGGGVESSGQEWREMGCIGRPVKALDVIDLEEVEDCAVVEVGKEAGRNTEKKEKKNEKGAHEASKKHSTGNGMMGFRETMDGQVSDRSWNAENEKQDSGFVKLDCSSEEESPLLSSSEEEDNLEDEDYAAEKSSSDFMEPKDGEAAIDEVSSEDDDSFLVEEVREVANESHLGMQRNKEKNKKEKENDTEEDEETVSLVRRNRVARQTKSHDIVPRQGIGAKKVCTGTFEDPFFLEEDSKEDVVTSTKSSSAQEGPSPHETAGSKTTTSESMSMEYENVNDDASEAGSDIEGRNAKIARAKIGKPSLDKKILLGSIWGEEDLLDMTRELNHQAEPSSPKDKKITNRLFKWGDDSPSPPEKTPEQLQMEELWMELDFCLRTSEMETENADGVENDSQNHELDPCRRGDHDGILDEEIGIRCRKCGLIMQEIRDVYAPFIDDPIERRAKKDEGRGGGKTIDGLLNGNDDPMFQSNHSVKKDGSVWDLIPGVKESMYPHQIDGFEFIWKNFAGGLVLEELEKTKEYYVGSGCIISHAPGTGKTRLTIVFLQSYMNFHPKCQPVIIAPKSMLMTWEEEFRKWNVNVPFHNLNRNDLTGRENLAAVRILQNSMMGGFTVENVRWLKVQSWILEKSVLGVSYNLFEKLTREKGDNVVEEGKSMRITLLEKSGIVVMDEGHTPRNDGSLIWKATSNLKTRKRIILSGTPFQNNFDELHNTFSLVKPGFDVMFTPRRESNVRKRRSNRTGDDWDSLTGSISKNHDIEKLGKLKSLIAPFVHVHKGTILQDRLPGMSHCALYLRPRNLQKQLLSIADTLVNAFQKKHLVTLLSVHPSMLLEVPASEKRELFPDISQLDSLRLYPEDGVKTKFIVELLRLSEALNEKVLIFSEFLDPLDFIKEQLKSCYGWIEGREILKMDGKLDLKQRQTSINAFNNEASEVRVLLASTGACSEGISLVGASRVVLLDSAWNPSVERQAISRAYRLGQKKFVYIYHLLAFGSSEEDTYRQQVEKDVISNMIFPLTEKNEPLRPDSTTKVPEDKILEAMWQHSSFKELIEKVVYHKKEANLMETFGRQLALIE